MFFREGKVPKIESGQILEGDLFSEPMRIVTVIAEEEGSWTIGLVGLRTEKYRTVHLTSADLQKLKLRQPAFSFDGNGEKLRLGLQAYSIGIAYEFVF